MILDLFYSKTKFELNHNTHFPYSDVIGIVLYVNDGVDLPLHISRIYNERSRDKNIIVFEVADEAKTLDLKICCDLKYKHKDERDIYTYTYKILDTYENYCGCITVTENFVKWLNTLQGRTILLKDDSLVINPSMCYYNNQNNDKRLVYNNTPLNKIILEGVLLEKQSTSEYILHGVTDTALQDTDSNYIQRLLIKGDDSEVELYGKSVCIMMKSPDSGEFCKTSLTFDGERLLFEDASLK